MAMLEQRCVWSPTPSTAVADARCQSDDSLSSADSEIARNASPSHVSCLALCRCDAV